MEREREREEVRENEKEERGELLPITAPEVTHAAAAAVEPPMQTWSRLGCREIEREREGGRESWKERERERERER